MKRLLSAAIPLLMGLLLAACETGGAGSVERPLMGKVVGLPPIVVDSLEEVGKEYAKYVKLAMFEPYMLGWHYCGYIEGAEGMPHPLVASQSGFKDPFENVHEETIEHVRLANGKAREWHAKGR